MTSDISTPEKLAALIANPDIPKIASIEEGVRITWIGQQLSALNYMAHTSREVTEIDLLIEAKMIDAAITSDGALGSLTQAEMQEAFRRGVTREYGDYYGITAASVVGFLRGFLKSEKRMKAVALVSADEEARRKEGEARFWKAIYEKKVAAGLSVGRRVQFETVDSEAHRRKIEDQRRQILEQYGKEGM